MAAARLELPDGWERRAFVLPGLSQVYRDLATSLRRRSRAAASPAPILDELLEHLQLGPRAAWDRIGLVTFSAGYALAEELLASPIDAAAIACWLALDSGYGTVPPGVVAFARRARAGEVIYHAGATDVPTYGYDDSRTFLASMLAGAGVPVATPLPAGLVHAEGGLRVERWAHDPEALQQARAGGLQATIQFWEGEHRGALQTHGPAFVARALDLVDAGVAATATTTSTPLRPGDRGPRVQALQHELAEDGYSPGPIDGVYGPRTEAAVVAYQGEHGLLEDGAGPDTLAVLATKVQTPSADSSGVADRDLKPDNVVHRDLKPDNLLVAGGSLGERALAIALEELAKGVQEEPLGSNRGPEVDAYERPTGLHGEAWCEAFESWCRRRALGADEPDELGYHAAVAAFWRAAVRAGRARPKEYSPKPGDAAIFRRLVNGRWRDPTKGENGHVGRVEIPPGAASIWTTIDGNHHDRVDRVEHPDLVDVVGWVDMS